MSTMEGHLPDRERHRFEEIAAQSERSSQVLEESRRDRVDIEARLRASRRVLKRRRAGTPLGRLLTYILPRRG